MVFRRPEIDTNSPPEREMKMGNVKPGTVLTGEDGTQTLAIPDLNKPVIQKAHQPPWIQGETTSPQYMSYSRSQGH